MNFIKPNDVCQTQVHELEQQMTNAIIFRALAKIPKAEIEKFFLDAAGHEILQRHHAIDEKPAKKVMLEIMYVGMAHKILKQLHETIDTYRVTTPSPNKD